jgi:DNA polymerase-1
MNKKNLLGLLDGISSKPSENKNVLVIDSLNLFFRNFSVINTLNNKGDHIGGLGGFLKSLGYLIKQTDPSQIYLVFDGENSSLNRKNILPEYKSGRASIRINSKGIFDDKDEEIDSQINQISRLFQYLKVLPVKLLVLEKSEADDIIAYLSSVLTDNKIYIVSNDKDFLQLIKPNITVFRPTEKIYYSPELVKQKFGVLVENFILYKTLLGDSSDKVIGVKGLGEKKLLSKFPQLTEKVLSLDDIFSICEENIKEHIIYARILQDYKRIQQNYKLMDLSEPMIDHEGEEYINNIIDSRTPQFNSGIFNKLQEEDNLEKIIRNPLDWAKNVFLNLK